tara:strand:+ start:155 stop:391 length:237 start_codon:yes stop_codon:yes gene_type:complete
MSQIEYKHGWYSEIQRNRSSQIIYNDNKKHSSSYIYLNENGDQIYVTEVCDNKDSYNLKSFPDAEYRGVVVKWVKSFN